MKIKQVLLASCLMLAALRGTAQSVSPRDEFKVFATPSQIRLAKGSVDSVELTIIRAKHFKAIGTFNLTSPLPKGISVVIYPIPDKPDHFVMKLKADDSTDPEEFYVVPSYSLSGGTKKGVLIKVFMVEGLLSETK